MKAIELKKRVNVEGSVTIEVLDLTDNEYGTNLTDHGCSFSATSTYMESGLRATITDAVMLPPLPQMSDTELYERLVEPNFIYFVFDHGAHQAFNEERSSKNWIGDTVNGIQETGSAIEMGAYTGFDIVGFPPDMDVSTLFKILESTS